MVIHKNILYNHVGIKKINLEKVENREAPAQNFNFPRHYFFGWYFEQKDVRF